MAQQPVNVRNKRRPRESKPAGVKVGRYGKIWLIVNGQRVPGMDREAVLQALGRRT